MNLLAVTWNVDPVFFSVGSLSIRYYSLCFIIAFFISYILFKRFFKDAGFKIELLDKLTFYYVIPATLIGARLGHCLFYQPEYYLRHPLEIILPFSNGEFVGYRGLASHGAAIGILIALILYSRNNKISILWLLDRIGIAVAISGSFVRLGNLMNSEVYGVETDAPWGFIFVRAGEVVPKHPTQLYEGLSYLLIFILLYWLYRKKRNAIEPGVLFGVFLILLFTARFLIEFIKEVQVEFEEGLFLVVGQWLSLPFILLGVVILYMSLKQK
ncbi:MAG: prolipoprotein diacylglyceryl transferase [Prevotellaceae bacterium]|jgi:prolipoprotein diacylglyceryl transferase|nr:prolipoprotein diacylglyceryl transferase [Prevotellaceae bacterium]